MMDAAGAGTNENVLSTHTMSYALLYCCLTQQERLCQVKDLKSWVSNLYNRETINSSLFKKSN